MLQSASEFVGWSVARAGWSRTCSSGRPSRRRDLRALFDGESLEGWHGGTTHDPRKITPEDQAKWDAAVPNHWRVENGELVNDGNEPHLVTDARLRRLRNVGRLEALARRRQRHLPARLSAGAAVGSSQRGRAQERRRQRLRRTVEQREARAIPHRGGRQAHRRVEPHGRSHGRPVREGRAQRQGGGRQRSRWRTIYDRKIPVPARGAIHLQTHGSETRFRNIFVREIPADEAERAARRKSAAARTEFTPLFNGKDFSGLDRRHRRLRNRRRRHSLQRGPRRQSAHRTRVRQLRRPAGVQAPARRQQRPGDSHARRPTSTRRTRASSCRCSTTRRRSTPTCMTTSATAAPTAWRPRTAATCGRRASGTTRRSPSKAIASRCELNGVEILDVDLAEGARQPAGRRRTPRRLAHHAATSASPATTTRWQFRNVRIKELD